MTAKSTTNKQPPKTKTKKVTDPSVGQLLKNRRLARGESLADVERAIRVRGKYLVAIEGDNYRELPHNVYTRGFIQSYARHLDLDSAEVLAKYNQQRGKQELQLRRPTGLVTPRLTLTPRLLTALGSILFAAAVAGYLVWQLSALTAPPKLEVSNPSKDQVLYGSLLTVNGHVAGGADVFVNDSPILVDGNGNFTDAIALQEGVNSIQVTAKNRLGKNTTITRNILAHVPKTDPASGLPQQPFDGVAVGVQVQGGAAQVTVNIDGKQKFKGTMLPGTNLTFKGTSDVVISTSNAGATNLTVTNSTTANKNLGALGRDNHPKTGFEFAKDTQFQ